MSDVQQTARRRGIRSGLVGVTALSLVAGLAGSAMAQSSSPILVAVPPPEPGQFRMGIEPWLGYGPWWVAQERGIFAQNGLDVTVINFDADDQINAALVSGQIEGANIATHTALRLASEGTAITIVLLLDQSNAADAILAGPEVASVADLRGKQVAYEEGTTSDILLRYALSENGMTIADIAKVPMPAAQAGVAAIAGQVPAAVTYEPYLTVALQQNPQYKLIYEAGQKPGLIGDVFVVRNDYLATHPGQVDALIATWGGAVAEYNTNTADAQGIIEKAVGADAGSLKTAFDGVRIYDLQEARDLMTGGAYLTTLGEVKAIATDAGIMSQPVDEAALMDTSYIVAVVP
jgi:NitT/TauT family transport system substrate-binding protein